MSLQRPQFRNNRPEIFQDSNSYSSPLRDPTHDDHHSFSNSMGDVAINGELEPWNVLSFDNFDTDYYLGSENLRRFPSPEVNRLNQDVVDSEHDSSTNSNSITDAEHFSNDENQRNDNLPTPAIIVPIPRAQIASTQTWTKKQVQQFIILAGKMMKERSFDEAMLINSFLQKNAQFSAEEVRVMMNNLIRSEQLLHPKSQIPWTTKEIQLLTAIVKNYQENLQTILHYFICESEGPKRPVDSIVRKIDEIRIELGMKKEPIDE